MFIAPDWKDAAAYRHLEAVPLRSIAWEFLRRQKKYQDAWSAFACDMRRLVATDAALAEYVDYLLLPSGERLRDGLGAPRAKWSDEEHERLQGFMRWDFESEDEEVREWGLWRALARRHGSPVGVVRIVHPQSDAGLELEFLDPATGRFDDAAPVVEIRSGGLAAVEQAVAAEEVGLFSESRWLALLVDLSAPLDVIKTDVMDWIRSEKRAREKQGFFEPVTNRGQRKEVYITYLRILDGIAAGEEITRIGGVLAPDDRNEAVDGRPRDKRTRAALKTATDLRDGGYRRLLRLESWQVRKKN